MSVSDDLRSGISGLGIRSLFEVCMAWNSHGFFGMRDVERLKEICEEVFGPPSEETRVSFVRAMRSYGDDDRGDPASVHDMDLLRGAIDALGRVMEVEMPAWPERVGAPALRGH